MFRREREERTVQQANRVCGIPINLLYGAEMTPPPHTHAHKRKFEQTKLVVIESVNSEVTPKSARIIYCYIPLSM